MKSRSSSERTRMRKKNRGCSGREIERKGRREEGREVRCVVNT